MVWAGCLLRGYLSDTIGNNDRSRIPAAQLTPLPCLKVNWLRSRNVVSTGCNKSPLCILCCFKMNDVIDNPADCECCIINEADRNALQRSHFKDPFKVCHGSLYAVMWLVVEPREFNLPTLPQRRITYVPEKLPSKYGVHSEEYLPIRTGRSLESRKLSKRIGKACEVLVFARGSRILSLVRVCSLKDVASGSTSNDWNFDHTLKGSYIRIQTKSASRILHGISFPERVVDHSEFEQQTDFLTEEFVENLRNVFSDIGLG
ncbi:hypothetical protein ANN_20016 [Periplaneta americana]|uniref:Uncharacterized protein n=1 Tax=Periplaneta americana TaxID=6978 RepID=A0ABQ8SC22_PERAM|nr:hypothetical protein ANN_20016 [Periplaneta americana]